MPQPARDRRRPATTATTHRSAKVTRVDPDGQTYVTPLNGDPTHVIGPCRGSWRREASTCPSGTHAHPLQPLAVGTVVLLATIPGDSPWIVQVDEHP